LFPSGKLCVGTERQHESILLWLPPAIQIEGATETLAQAKSPRRDSNGCRTAHEFTTCVLPFSSKKAFDDNLLLRRHRAERNLCHRQVFD
jgi:hypothetical protein